MTRLTGSRSLCPSCHQRFNSTYAFDRHRVGAYPSHRRCLTHDEMIARGMLINARGFWITEARQLPCRLSLGRQDSSGFGDPPLGSPRGRRSDANRRNAKGSPSARKPSTQLFSRSMRNSKSESAHPGRFFKHGISARQEGITAQDQVASSIIRSGGEP